MPAEVKKLWGLRREGAAARGEKSDQMVFQVPSDSEYLGLAVFPQKPTSRMSFINHTTSCKLRLRTHQPSTTGLQRTLRQPVCGSPETPKYTFLRAQRCLTFAPKRVGREVSLSFPS